MQVYSSFINSTEKNHGALAQTPKAFSDFFPYRCQNCYTNRPKLQSLMKTVQKGDAVVVESISRFARNTRDLLDLVAKLTKKGVEFISLKEHIDTTTPPGRLVLTIFGAMYEFERETILQRQAEGIAAAKSQGKQFGRPIKKPPENFVALVKDWESGKINFDEALDQTELKQATFYGRLSVERKKATIKRYRFL